MQSGRRSSPRHLASAPQRRPAPPGTRRPAPARHLAAPVRPSPAPAAEVLLEDEVSPLARVRRSRLAFALSATVAALPILVMDNLPATAAVDRQDALEVVAEEPSSSSSAADDRRTTLREPSTTTVVVDEADAEDEETTTSEAEPTTTETTTATSSTSSAAESSTAAISTLRAPAPTAPPTTAAPSTTTSAAPAPAPPVEPDPDLAYGDPADPATWDRLARCESGGVWDLDSGNGYYGGLQFSLGTWQGVGGSGYPHDASRDEQIRRGQILQGRYGWGQWPHCSAKLGYR